MSAFLSIFMALGLLLGGCNQSGTAAAQTPPAVRSEIGRAHV